MKNKWIGLLLAVAVLMASCVKPEEVMVENVDSFQVKSVSGSLIHMDAGLKVTNLSGSKLMLRRSSAVYTLPLVVRFEGLGGLLGIGSAFSSGMKGCTVSVEATLRGGWAKKKFRLDDIPAETLLRQAGVDPAEFLKQYQLQ